MKCSECEKCEECRTKVNLRSFRGHCVPIPRSEPTPEIKIMKFYYDGELIRTSKTKVYTHTVVAPSKMGARNKWVCYGCRSSRTGANRLLKEMRKSYRDNLRRLIGMRVVELEKRS